MEEIKKKGSYGSKIIDFIVHFRSDDSGLRSYGRMVFFLWLFCYTVVYLVSYQFDQEENFLVLHLAGAFFVLMGIPMIVAKKPNRPIFFYHLTQIILLPLLPFILSPVDYDLSSMSSILTLLFFFVLLFAKYIASEKPFTTRELLLMATWSYAVSTYLNVQYGITYQALPLFLIINALLHVLILIVYELVRLGLHEHQEKQHMIHELSKAHKLLAEKSQEEKGALEQELFQAQKMEALGQLAGGIAHDFNNVLASISGYADLIRKRFGEGNPDLLRYVDTILNASERAAGLISQLLAYARRGKFQKRIIDMHKMIESVLELLQHTLGSNIRIFTSMTANPPTIMGDPDQVQNALINLAINARDAMPEGGNLSFRTEVQNISKSQADEYPFKVKPGDYLLLEVQDTGTGMSQEIQEKVFEPFYTTKGAGKGTGLGLAGVYGCVKGHQAFITLDSVVGKGTTFSIFWPLARENSESEKIENSSEKSQTENSQIKGEGTVLVIDDEPAVRTMAGDMLRSYGFNVLEGEDGIDGLKKYRENSDKIKLVLLDMMMPRMDGRECFLRIHKENEDVPVLLFSGFSSNERIQDLLDKGAAGYLQKPFKVNEFIEKVKALTVC